MKRKAGGQKGVAPVHDGYRVHVNPDGSCVFIEGRKMNERRAFGWTNEMTRKLDACYRRMGLHIKNPRAHFAPQVAI